MSALSTLFRRAPRAKRWKSSPADLPWFDQTDALQQLDRRAREERYSDEQVEMLRKWVKDGYCVVGGVIDTKDVDGMMADFDAIWTAKTPTPGLEVLGARIAESDPMVRPHADLLKLDAATRDNLRDNSPWRVHGFSRFSKSAAAIYQSEKLLSLASLIFGRPAVRDATINFMYGSRQALHQDMAVFHVFPMNYLIGAWLACEDIHPDSGPLLLYAGSHKEPMYPAFDNYPQTNLKTCSAETKAAYESYLAEASERYERRTFLGKKGEVLLWHGMLLHGGDAVKNPRLTRRSYVCHYMAKGVNKAAEVVGPFNW